MPLSPFRKGKLHEPCFSFIGLAVVHLSHEG